MSMTNQNMAPPVIPNPKQQAVPKTQDESLEGVADQVSAELRAEEAAIKAQMHQQKALNPDVAIADLCEDDAYNLDVNIKAIATFDPMFLKIECADPNYTGRWGHKSSMRQSQLAAQGFKVISAEDLTDECKARLEQFKDSLGHYAWADLIGMKIPKNIYYAGIRNAYVKSLYATDNRKSREIGAAHATQDLNNSLRGHERAYLDRHVATTNKQVYNPTVGV